MAGNNIKILFWIHKSKQNRKGEAPIYLRITYNSERKNISTGFNVAPSRWDGTKGVVKGLKEDAVQINGYISQTKARLMELFNEMLKEQDINLDKLIERFFGKDVSDISLLELVELHNKDFESRIDIDYARSTFEKYDILQKKLKAFIPYKYQKKDIRLRDLTHQFIMDFDFYLKSHDKNEHNTATKYLKNLKKIVNTAVIKGWLDDNPFEAFKSPYKDVDRIYLTQVELEIIRQKTFKQERLSLIRDIFLFQCYTGLSYVDMSKLVHNNITDGIDGRKWIITRRRKTNVRAAIPLLNQAQELLARYNTSCADSNTPIFPFYSIQKFNSYLHEIAELCSINKNLTSHVGRRTFATTIALANGVGLETISKILGHSNTRITSQYAVVNDIKLSLDMEELRRKLGDKTTD
ncbi:site-specific integrase [Pinibacter aurantiacus]|uniref:Site-specific integrase n=1 Tax=Pinibacter aurantiacus TaxID=2851599 RepID=A0A9E2S6Y3_9BACT|nr:site-specific integrase [Pinibacter aurantiacus]MBV4357713.1 site-specific integrase [Pinibacter aurantiacus]